jgi:hypothetical protein
MMFMGGIDATKEIRFFEKIGFLSMLKKSDPSVLRDKLFKKIGFLSMLKKSEKKSDFYHGLFIGTMLNQVFNDAWISQSGGVT